MKEHIEFIKRRVSRRTVLEQAMEECAEVIRALSKVIRAEAGAENPTPLSKEQAIDCLKAELTDLDMCLSLLPEFEQRIDVSTCPKWKRWADRIKAAERL